MPLKYILVSFQNKSVIVIVETHRYAVTRPEMTL